MKSKKRLVEILRVDREKNSCYVAIHSPPPYSNECTNDEWYLNVTEVFLGITLLDGEGERYPILMFYWKSDYWPSKE